MMLPFSTCQLDSLHVGLDSKAMILMQVIQLYEMIIVRHGLMVVGLPFSAKSSALAVLAGALGDLAAEGKVGALFNPVDMRIINPKAVTMGQLYGETDKATQEWKVSLATNILDSFLLISDQHSAGPEGTCFAFRQHCCTFPNQTFGVHHGEMAGK